MRLSLLSFSLALSLAACGTTGADGVKGRGEVTAAESGRNESLASLLRRRYPSLRVEETATGLFLQIRQYERPPLIVIDGTRYPSGRPLVGLRASEIVDVKVLKTMAEAMVYGTSAALGGVIEITTTLGRER